MANRSEPAAGLLVLLIVAALGVTGTDGVSSTNAARVANTGLATGFIERFEVPERDADGNLRWKLRGERAQFKENGEMDLFQVHAEFYRSNEVQVVFTTPTCTLNQAAKRAVTDGPVHLQHDNIVVTGQGAQWSGDDHWVIVHSNVVVVIGAQSPRADEPAPAPASPEE